MKNCLKFYQQYKDKYQCERGKTKHGALANILICLEKAIQDGNITLRNKNKDIAINVFFYELHF